MQSDSHLDEDSAYRAIATHDARFDGRLFVGVTSTGVYCRPVCRVRTPMRRNCRFFGNAPSAEASGFRPCLRCRPEQAPGLALVDSPQVLAQHAARMIEHAVRSNADLPLPAVAGRLGVTDRHLRRVFVAAFGVTPMDFLTTQRLLLAKQLLTDTALPVADVALACGFSSQRRFNAVFVERCRMSPTRLRSRSSARTVRKAGALPVPRSNDVQDGDALKARVGYRPPYDVDGVLRFYAERAVAGVESAPADGSLRRTVHWPDAAGWLALRFLRERNEVELAMAPTLARHLGRIVEMVRQALDLDADPGAIDAALQALPGRAGTRLCGGMDGFEIATRVILGQQVTVAAARTLTARLVERFGRPITTPFADLSRLFPGAEQIAAATAEDIGTLGIVRQRVGALQALAREVHGGRIELHRGAPLHATLDALRDLPGIGEWTVQLIAMRALAWPDAFPASDIGVMNALGTRDLKSVAAMAEAWRPWRSYAVMRLWQSLETSP